MELISLHQPEEFQKGQKETPHLRPPPRILLSDMHFDWTRHAPPGRTLVLEWLAKDNPETDPITIKPCDCKPCDRAVLLGPLTLLLSARAPFPNKSTRFVSICVSSDNSFLSVRQEPSLGRGPLSYNSIIRYKDGYHNVKRKTKPRSYANS